MVEHLFSGCRTKPLTGYLKAVGILRLLSEQKDPQARGFWNQGRFHLFSKLDKDRLEKFFCLEYSPTPIVAPWNGGSGFYLGDQTAGMDAILACTQDRFFQYRSIINQIKSWPEIPKFDTVGDLEDTLGHALAGLREGNKKQEIERILESVKKPPDGSLEKKLPSQIRTFPLESIEAGSKNRNDPDQRIWKVWWNLVKKARTKCNTLMREKYKNELLPICRTRLPEDCLAWTDAVFAIRADGGAAFNPLLGTGGNEGRLDFSNNFMQNIARLFIHGDPKKTVSLFKAAVYDETTENLIEAKIGQYDPGRAGGYNQGMEIETKEFKINPWDFILSIEGALLLAGAAVRRYPTQERTQFTAPFTVWFSPVGFTSSAEGEKGRSETWFPLWEKPASYKEIKQIFSEGRTTLSRRIARTGLEFTRAIGTLGVDRGINAFERYAFLERRGKSYAAVPLGQIGVFHRPLLHLLDELDPILRAADRFLRQFTTIPATLVRARSGIDNAVFDVCQNPDAHRFSSLVRAIGRLERLVSQRDRSKDPAIQNPLFGLFPRWIEAADDQNIETRIAAALASIHATEKVGPIRSYLAGASPSNPRKWDAGKGDAFWFGNNLIERMGGLLIRRLMDQERRNAPRVPIEAHLPLSPHDVMPFLLGETDDIKIEELLWGFSLIKWNAKGLRKIQRHWHRPISDQVLSRTWCLLKLLHNPEKIRDKKIRIEPRIVHLLNAGRPDEACRIAKTRLRISGLNPHDVVYREDIDPKRLLASLLIPIRDPHILEKKVLGAKTINP